MLLSLRKIRSLHRWLIVSLVIPPGFGLASIILTGPEGTQPYVTTIGVGLADAGGDFVGVANRVFDSYASVFDTLTNDKLIFDRVSLLVGSDGGNGSVDSDLAPRQAVRSVDMAPTAMSLIARKNTAVLGRRGRGRMFIPGVLADGDVMATGAIEAASKPIFEDALEEFLTSLSLVGPSIYPIAPPYLLHSEGASSTSPSPITSLTPGPLVGWIRKRIR